MSTRAIPRPNSPPSTLRHHEIIFNATPFDQECNRTLPRATDATHEFTADETEISVRSYPIETVTRFELNKLGLKTIWPHEGNYMQFLDSPLLPAVKATLKKYERWTL